MAKLFWTTRCAAACAPYLITLSSASALADAPHTYQPELNSSLCLDLAGGVATPGAPAQIAQCSGNPAQMWTQENGTLQSLGLCLDVPANNQTNGVELQVWNCLPNDAAQQWTFSKGNLRLSGTNFCVDVTNGHAADGQRLQLWTCDDGHSHQAFSQHTTDQSGASSGSANAGAAPTAGGSVTPAENGRELDMHNKCGYEVWVALQNNGGQPVPSPSGFGLAPGASSKVIVPNTWGGRVWGRTGCAVASQSATCDSGDCGRMLQCQGIGGQPASLVEFLFNGYAGPNAKQDYYDISLVDAFNLPVGVAPIGGSGTCHAPSCGADLLASCRDDLQVKNQEGKVTTCLSECSRYQTDATCCRGQNSTPATCPRPAGQQVVKEACPDAYSYAYDDGTSTWNCTNPKGYTITFCP